MLAEAVRNTQPQLNPSRCPRRRRVAERKSLRRLPSTAFTVALGLHGGVSRACLKGAIAKPSSVDVRHPLAFVLEEGAAGDVRPYAAAKKQQSETQSEYLYVRHVNPSPVKIAGTGFRLAAYIRATLVTRDFGRSKNRAVTKCP